MFAFLGIVTFILVFLFGKNFLSKYSFKYLSLVCLPSQPLSFCIRLIAYPITRPIMLKAVSVLSGVTITIIVKLIMSMLLNRNFAGFYRKAPLIANIASLGFECWHLAVAVSYVFTRAIIMLLICICYIGRIDRPVFSDGVGQVGSFSLDRYPDYFFQDLLATDAHRHPYIERLGLMYLMKLKHGDKFATKAGSTWRLLFVFALMPYLRKDRIIESSVISKTYNNGEQNRVPKVTEGGKKMLSLGVGAVEDLLDDDGVSYDAIKFVRVEQRTNENVNDEIFLEDDDE